MMNEPISTIMTKEVVTVRPEDTLAVVKDILFSKHLHHLPVVSNKKLVGIVTSFDLFKLGKSFEEYGGIKVKEVMTTQLAKLSPSDKVGTAAEIFLRNLFHGIPIVNAHNELLGVITTHDILKYEFYKEYPQHRQDWEIA